MKKTFIGPYGEQLEVHLSSYTNNGNLSVRLTDEEGPYTTLSTNVEAKLGEGEFYVKVDDQEEVVDAALKSGLFVDTGRWTPSGHTVIPIWRLV